MLSHRPRAQRLVSFLVLTAVVAIAGVLLFRADQYGPQVAWIGAWAPPLGISLVADRLSALMLLVSAVVTLAVLAYSVGQGMTGDEREAPVSIYHPTFLVLVAGVSNAFLAGDLFNLFVELRDAALRQLCTAHPRGHGDPDPCRDDLRRGEHALFDPVPHLPGSGVRRDRKPQPRTARRAHSRPARPS